MSWNVNFGLEFSAWRANSTGVGVDGSRGMDEVIVTVPECVIVLVEVEVGVDGGGGGGKSSFVGIWFDNLKVVVVSFVVLL